MKTLKKIGIRLALFIAVMCCIELVAHSITSDTVELTELTSSDTDQETPPTKKSDSSNSPDDIIHDQYIIYSFSSLRKESHFHPTYFIPYRQACPVWQPPQIA